MITTFEAPIAFATSNDTRPIGPAPQMRTLWPRVTSARRHAWIPTESGSIKAPSSYVTFSGSLDEGTENALVSIKDRLKSNAQVKPASRQAHWVRSETLSSWRRYLFSLEWHEMSFCWKLLIAPLLIQHWKGTLNHQWRFQKLFQWFKSFADAAACTSWSLR